MSTFALDAAWAALDHMEASAGSLRARQVEGLEIAGRSAFVAIDWQGYRHLLIPTNAENEVAPDSRSGGVRIAQHDLVDGAQKQRFVDVWCLKPHLNPLFDVVASDMLVAAAAVLSDDVAFACRRVLDRWRELIEKVVGEPVGTERLAGVWAELWFVREAVRRGCAFEGLWVGPAGGRHDLTCESGSDIEVKATLATGPLLVEIHGLEQLELPQGGRLFLGVLKLSLAPAEGESLADLVDGVVDAGAPRGGVLLSLAAVGLSSEQTEVLQTRFSIWERRLYDVTEDFPRIVAASFRDGRVPPGTTRVSYLLDLTGEPPNPMSDPSYEDAMNSLAKR